MPDDVFVVDVFLVEVVMVVVGSVFAVVFVVVPDDVLELPEEVVGAALVTDAAENSTPAARIRHIHFFLIFFIL